MPYTKYTTQSKTRLLISGMPNTGKTHSLSTFIYGPFDYYSDDLEERKQALEHAEQQNKQMAILSCPGEKGIKSLHHTDHITSYIYETSKDEDVADVKWSKTALDSFNYITHEVIVKDEPDILVVDGFHSLWDQIMNRTTNGDYLKGLSIGSDTNPYEAARLYSQAHNAFGQYITALYHSNIPLIVATTWEDWESGTTEAEAGKAQSIGATRYLWPAIPGKMGKAIVGQFDARVSARLEKKCFHDKCSMRDKEEHFVWQFLSKNDVRGVGIKGLRSPSKKMKERPFIHQQWDILKQLMETYQ